MKIIDEKGKLFGKINLIDSLIILFLFCLIPTFYFGYKLLLIKEEKPKAFIEIEMSFKFIKVDPAVLKQIEIGDKEIDDKGTVIGEIIWLGESKPYEYKIDTGAKETRVIKDTYLKELLVRMCLKVEVKENSIIYYKNKRIIVNSPFYFSTDRYTVEVIPATIKKEEWMRVKVKFYGVSLELSDTIKIGDTENDSTGKTIGKLNKIISNVPTEVQAIKLDENRLIFLNEPYHNDVVVLLDILCNVEEGGLFFKDRMVKIGNEINFITDLYAVSGTIIGLEIK